MPILIVTEHHSGFDYNRTGTFLIPVTKKKGLVLYEDAVILRKDSSFDMAHTGLELISVTDDSITFVVGASFTKDSKPIEVTIHRGESVRYEDSKDCTATIYDEDYDYTIESYLEVSWK